MTTRTRSGRWTAARPVASAIAALLVSAGFTACSLFGDELPKEPPPLAGMQEPAGLFAEPADELERAALEPGSFSGLEVGDARTSLDALVDNPGGLSIARVVENSPAERAGLAVGDVLFAYRVGSDGPEKTLEWPSQWRELELASAPGTEVELVLERAGSERRARLVLAERYRPAARAAASRLREESRAGIVVRAATEVEARAHGLAPGAGAVVVGLSEDSPWRAAGVRFEDLIVALDGEALAAPDLLIARIRSAPEDARLRLSIRRKPGAQAGAPGSAPGAAPGGAAEGAVELEVPLTERASEVREISIPLLFSYESSRGESETSLLFGLIHVERTRAAWKLRLVWLLRFSGGDSDRLEEVEH